MKKSLKALLVAAVVALIPSLVLAVTHFTETLPPAATAGCVPVSNGYDYQCSTDSGSTPITNGIAQQLFSRTIAQFNALAPSAAGQLAYCSNCTASQICVSSGTGTGAWVAISSATAGVSHCN